ncbi:progranulin-like [Artemia franciscana]|uniref:progranulin-like n=1 Tax=Artemia franciscana TaxID=6661 RepID=UPI0032DB319A
MKPLVSVQIWKMKGHFFILLFAVSTCVVAKDDSNLLTNEITASSVICPGGAYQCPDGYTCCPGIDYPFSCCPLFHATCCSDRVHCCPFNFRCTPGGCFRSGSIFSNALFNAESYKQIEAEEFDETLNKFIDDMFEN